MAGSFALENEVCIKNDNDEGYWLCLQWGHFDYGDGTGDYGYRFIWRNPGGKQLARPARLPSLAVTMRLMAEAIQKGWGCKQAGDAEDLSIICEP